MDDKREAQRDKQTGESGEDMHRVTVRVEVATRYNICVCMHAFVYESLCWYDCMTPMGRDRFGTLSPEGRRLESHSSHHVGTYRASPSFVVACL